MDTENYISPSKITKQYDITSGTLRRWSEAGKIRCLRPNGGKRIYNIEDINKIFSSQKDNNDTNNTNDTSNNKIKDSIKVLKETINKKSEKEDYKEDYKDFIDFLETELQDVQNLIANMKVKK